MSNEVELAYVGMWTEAIKILGPALLTGLLGYFTGRLDYGRRLLNMKSQQEFSAREVLFNLKKQRFDSMNESAKSFLGATGEFIGYYTGYEASPGKDLPVSAAVRFLDISVTEMLDDVRWITEEFGTTEHYRKDKGEIERIRTSLEDFKAPTNTDQVFTSFKAILAYFNVLQRVASKSLDDEMQSLFKKYLV